MGTVAAGQKPGARSQGSGRGNASETVSETESESQRNCYTLIPNPGEPKTNGMTYHKGMGEEVRQEEKKKLIERRGRMWKTSFNLTEVLLQPT